MNTPSHSILNLAVLGRAKQPELTWPILIGSWLPDIALFVFYGWAKAMNLPASVIWQEAYYAPTWQDIFAIGNSIPLALLGLGLARWRQWPAGAAVFASALLHHAADLPLHHDDAHRHFWPLSDVRLISPVSYWDVNHGGRYGALAELIGVAIASGVLLRRVRSRLGRSLIILVSLIYVIGYALFYL